MQSLTPMVFTAFLTIDNSVDVRDESLFPFVDNFCPFVKSGVKYVADCCVWVICCEASDFLFLWEDVLLLTWDCHFTRGSYPCIRIPYWN